MLYLGFLRSNSVKHEAPLNVKKETKQLISLLNFNNV